MVPWRTIISSVSTNTTIVITATGPAELGAREVHEDQKADERRIGQPMHEGARAGRNGTERAVRRPQLLVRCGRERHVARDVEDILQTTRQVPAADFGERPQDVAQEHRDESAEQEHRDALTACVGEEQGAEGEQQDTIEGE